MKKPPVHRRLTAEKQALFDFYASLLGLEDWDFLVEYSDVPDPFVSAYGNCDTDVRYRRARIRLLEDQGDEEEDNTIPHELVHVLFAPLRHEYSYHISALPKKERKIAWERWLDQEEQSVVKLVKSLQKHLNISLAIAEDGDEMVEPEPEKGKPVKRKARYGRGRR